MKLAKARDHIGRLAVSSSLLPDEREALEEALKLIREIEGLRAQVLSENNHDSDVVAVSFEKLLRLEEVVKPNGQPEFATISQG